VTQVATRAELPRGSVITVMDATGLILARHPEDDLVGKTVPDSPVVREIRRLHGEGTLEALGLDGAERLYAFTTLAGPAGTQPLYVSVGLPRDAALAEADRLLFRNLVWAGIVVLLVLAAAVVVSNLFILRRLGAVVRAARRLTAGDLDARAEARGADEIAVMARAFNAMAERLQSRVKDEEEARHQLAERVNELDLLNQMGELLQSCFTLEEAYGVFGRLAPRLFPTEGGAIFALDASRDLIEAVATWGSHPTDADAFAVDDCWALRHGRTHVVEDTSSGVLCQHLPKPMPSAYLCTPLAPQGKPLGVLFVMVEPAPEGVPRALTHAKQRLAEAVAGQLGLGLGNVQLREVLRIQSIHDPLTGLFNRRYMEETLEREVHRARRSGRPMGVLMLDIDSFKQQNDAFGHEAGDAILRELGALLKGSLRREDIPCRYGGEEFVLVLPEASLDSAARRAEQIREAVKRLRIPFRDRLIGPITVSVGVAAFPDHGEDGYAVLQAADAALYDAKRAGRDRISVATLHPTV
jgi:diguanylate cyclase (GGDEF)-like protein